MYESVADVLNSPMVTRGLGAVAGIIVVVILIRIAHHSINRYIQDPDMRYRARKSASTAGWLLLFMYVVLLFSDALGQVAVVLGVASAGIAFALQEVIVSLAGWIAITFGHFFNVGDRVQLGGTVGDVIDVGMLRTTLMESGEWVAGDTYTGRIVLVANSFVFKQAVYNYSMDFPFLWDELNVPVRYGSDHQFVDEILLGVAEEVTGEYTRYAEKHWQKMIGRYRIDPASVEPAVLLAPTDNWVQYTLRYVVDYKHRRVTRDRLFRKILQRIERSDGRVQLASATHEIVGLPEIDVTVRREQ
ncbi:MAG: mechanosensitive ion channel family protein [Armatimonadota bacterium]